MNANIMRQAIALADTTNRALLDNIVEASSDETTTPTNHDEYWDDIGAKLEEIFVKAEVNANIITKGGTQID